MSELIKFRASSAGLLKTGGGLVDGERLTANQLKEYTKLIDKQTAFNDKKEGNKAKDLTPLQSAKLKDLQAKKDLPFEFGQTAKSHIEALWRQKVYGFREEINTDVLLKGLLTEQDVMSLVDTQVKSKDFRSKNEVNFKSKYFTGTPDTILKKDNVCEDMKSCWSLKTFFYKKALAPLYYCQGQVYMSLLQENGFDIQDFRVHYGLVNTPESIIQDLERKLYFRFGADEDNPHYLKGCEQIRKNHIIDHIPEKLRLKSFNFKYDKDYIKDLKDRVVEANKYYKTIKL